jgi:uncharacterized phage protein (TIGR02218 family)
MKKFNASHRCYSMKSFDKELINFLLTDQIESFYTADLFEIETTFGMKMYATDGQMPITYNGNVYDPVKYGIWKRGTVTTKLGMTSSTMDFTVMAEGTPMQGNMAQWPDGTTRSNQIEFTTDPSSFPGTTYPGVAGTDYFYARVSGIIQPSTSDTYTFTLQSDDGGALYINGKLLISNQGASVSTGSIAMVANAIYNITVVNNNDGLNRSFVRVTWSSPGSTPALVTSAPGTFFTCKCWKMPIPTNTAGGLQVWNIGSQGLAATGIGNGFYGFFQNGTEVVVPHPDSNSTAPDDTSSNRSYNLIVLDRLTMGIVSMQCYDVYGTPSRAGDLAAALNALDNTKIVLISTFDEPSGNRLLGGLPDAMVRCGASSVFSSNEFNYRSSYILVGIPGIGEGRGLENYVGPDNGLVGSEASFCSLKVTISNGWVEGITENQYPVNGGEVTVPNDFDISLMQAIQQGLFDGAKITVYTTYMPDYGDLVYGVEVKYSGQITELDKTGRTTAEGTAESYLFKLNQQMPRMMLQPACRWVLGDAGCTLDLSNFTEAGVVSSQGTSLQIQSQTPLTQADGYFTQGIVTMTSGHNMGLSMSVKQYKGGVINLTKPFLFPVQPGDTFQVTAGCDHTYATCQQKFGNLVNFGGMPWIPNYERAL